jgi:hypothetical protein
VRLLDQQFLLRPATRYLRLPTLMRPPPTPARSPAEQFRSYQSQRLPNPQVQARGDMAEHGGARDVAQDGCQDEGDAQHESQDAHGDQYGEGFGGDDEQMPAQSHLLLHRLSTVPTTQPEPRPVKIQAETARQVSFKISVFHGVNAGDPVKQPKGECDPESPLPCKCPRSNFTEPPKNIPMPATKSNIIALEMWIKNHVYEPANNYQQAEINDITDDLSQVVCDELVRADDGGQTRGGHGGESDCIQVHGEQGLEGNYPRGQTHVDEVQGVGGRWHDGAGGDHGVGLQAGEDDDARGRSPSYRTSQEKKRERRRRFEAQNLMMVQSHLVLFLATVIYDGDVSSYPTFNMLGKEDIYGKMLQIPRVCNTEGEMAYLRVVFLLGRAAATSWPATAAPVQSS